MVEGRRTQGLAVEVKAGRHTIVSGVSEQLGGHDEGPGPHSLLEASLAACTVITVQMYANRHKLKLDSTQVSVKIESEGGGETRISRKVQFVGELSAEERVKLLEIANKCPIHNLLISNVTIETATM